MAVTVRNVFQDCPFCPRCGERTLEVLDAKAVHCTSCEWLYFHNVAAAAAAILETAQGDVLLVRRGRNPGLGLLDLPGGFLDSGESAEAGLARELQEEVFLNIPKFQYVGSVTNEYIYGGMIYQTCDLIYWAELDQLPQQGAVGEIDEVVLRNLDSLRPDDFAFAATWQALELYRSKFRRSGSSQA